MKTVDFSETIEAFDLRVGRYRQLIDFMKVLSIEGQGHFLGERTGLVVRASDSGSGDPGSILGRVGVLFP